MSGNQYIKNATSIQDITVKNAILQYMLTYAEEVNLHRIFQDKYDGLKPSQRALLVTMYDRCRKGNKLKASKILGDAIGDYYPHGEFELYITGVNMAIQKNPLIVTPGSIKSKRSKKTAAPRYVEFGLSKLGKEMLSLIDTELVPKEPTYNNKKQMPTHLLSRFPYELFGDNFSIGWGISSISLPFNAGEILDAMIAMTKNPSITTDELMDIIKGPDMSDKTKIYLSKESLRSLIDRGHGLVTLVCDIEVSGNTVTIQEVPWRESSESLFVNIVQKIEQGRLSDKNNLKRFIKKSIDGVIRNSIEQSSNKDIDISMRADTSTDPLDLVDQLYKNTNLKKTYNIKFIMSDNNKLDLFSIRDILNLHIDINRKAIEYRYQQKLKKLRQEKDEAEVVELVTRLSNKEWFIEQLYHKDKRDRLLNRDLTPTEKDITSTAQSALTSLLSTDSTFEQQEEQRNKVYCEGLTSSQIDIALNKNIANKLSNRKEALDILESYEHKKAEIMVKFTDENIIKESVEYLEYIKTLCYTTRDSEVYYTNGNLKKKIQPVVNKDADKLHQFIDAENIENVQDNTNTFDNADGITEVITPDQEIIDLEQEENNITPEPKVVIRPDNFTVYVTEKGFIGVDLSTMEETDRIRYQFEVTKGQALLVFTRSEIYSIIVDDITDKLLHSSIYGIDTIEACTIYFTGMDYVLISNIGGYKKILNEDLAISTPSVKAYKLNEIEHIVDIVAVPLAEVYLDLVSYHGYIRRLNVLEMTYRKRTSKFVQGITLKENDQLIGARLATMDNSHISLVTANGVLSKTLEMKNLFRYIKSQGNPITSSSVLSILDDRLAVNSEYADEDTIEDLQSLPFDIQFNADGTLIHTDQLGEDEIPDIQSNILLVLTDQYKYYHKREVFTEAD